MMSDAPEIADEPLDDKEILRKIGQALVDIAPAEAEEMVFRGRIYPGFGQGMPSYISGEGEEVSFGQLDTDLPIDAIMRILELAAELNRTPPFEAAQFNHFEYRIDRNNAVSIEVDHIPESQTWNNLYMRRLSDLSWDEAEDLSVPLKDWRRARTEADGV